MGPFASITSGAAFLGYGPLENAAISTINKISIRSAPPNIKYVYNGLKPKRPKESREEIIDVVSGEVVW